MKSTLNSFIRVDRSEWEGFLEDLSEFEKKYRRLLDMMDAAERRLQALGTPEKMAGRDEASRQVPLKSRESVAGVGAGGGFLSRLETKLEALGNALTAMSVRPGVSKAPAGYASCSQCGFQITRPTRSCQRCGADFGKLVCSCGSELSSGVRFCDRCGREV